MKPGFWSYDGEEYFACSWNVFLGTLFKTDSTWSVVLNRRRADLFAPVADFRRSFLLAVILSLSVVFLLSLSQIRRILGPLTKLKAATASIAKGEFDTEVHISSDDEFEELAGSFNGMANELNNLFTTLTAVSEIDRIVLGTLDTEVIIDTVLSRVRRLFPCDVISVTLLSSGDLSVGRTFVEGGQETEQRKRVVRLRPEGLHLLRSDTGHFLMLPKDDRKELLEHAAVGVCGTLLVLPFRIKDEIAGFLTMGHETPPNYSEEDLSQISQLVERLAVALSNARRMEDLNELNWGTLRACARAIDAKSHWTAGHSERVTEMALKIGRVMGLGHEELQTMHRGGLLHDIGKIGTPAAILDKSAGLTETEFEIVKEHPGLGARILEPISAYAGAIPIVLHHHERFDGKGYPCGLRGEEISLYARIFAVADCYDAMVSDRPYRKGMDELAAIDSIETQAGAQFDPLVVEAFLQVAASQLKLNFAENTL